MTPDCSQCPRCGSAVEVLSIGPDPVVKSQPETKGRRRRSVKQAQTAVGIKLTCPEECPSWTEGLPAEQVHALMHLHKFKDRPAVEIGKLSPEPWPPAHGENWWKQAQNKKRNPK